MSEQYENKDKKAEEEDLFEGWQMTEEQRAFIESLLPENEHKKSPKSDH